MNESVLIGVVIVVAVIGAIVALRPKGGAHKPAAEAAAVTARNQTLYDSIARRAESNTFAALDVPINLEKSER